MTLKILNPYAGPGSFRKAQLHCHTTESDGRFRPAELLRMYKETGYSFVCLTDHNRVTRCDDLNDSTFLAIPGTEDTVSRFLPPLGPHMGRAFVTEALSTGSAQERIERTLAEGGVAALCHPSWNGNLWTGSWSREAVQSLQGFHLLEIWNPHSDSGEDVRRWEATLRTRGPRAPVWGVAVDDCHRRDQFNRGWIMVKVAAVQAPALRSALLAGAFYASTGPTAEFRVEGDAVRAELAVSGRIRFCDVHGRTRSEVVSKAGRYAVRGDEGVVRVECVTDRGRVWSQPFWITDAPAPPAQERAAESRNMGMLC